MHVGHRIRLLLFGCVQLEGDARRPTPEHTSHRLEQFGPPRIGVWNFVTLRRSGHLRDQRSPRSSRCRRRAICSWRSRDAAEVRRPCLPTGHPLFAAVGVACVRPSRCGGAASAAAVAKTPPSALMARVARRREFACPMSSHTAWRRPRLRRRAGSTRSAADASSPPTRASRCAGSASALTHASSQLRDADVTDPLLFGLPFVWPARLAWPLSLVLERRRPFRKEGNLLIFDLLTVVKGSSPKAIGSLFGSLVGNKRSKKISCQSGRRDLNPRPLDPQSSALPNCATSRHYLPGACATSVLTLAQNGHQSSRRQGCSRPGRPGQPGQHHCGRAPAASLPADAGIGGPGGLRRRAIGGREQPCT